MKALLTLLLIVSLAVNIVLLMGCVSVEAPRHYSPTQLLDSNTVKGIQKLLTSEQQDVFQKERDFLDSHQGKIVIFLDDTEENRSAKRILVRFTDGQ